MMGQYFLLEYEWGSDTGRKEIEEQMLKNFVDVVKNSNLIESDVESEKARKSLFLIEPMFQEIQHNYYRKSEKKMTSEDYEEKIKEFEIIMLE